MLIKICGIQTVEAAQVATNAGADFIGFVFAKSSRQITAKKAAEICKTLPASVKKVGVFVNEQQAMIEKIASQVGLDVIQLHGDEPPSMIDKLPYETIKAFSIDDLKHLSVEQYNSDYYIVDSPPTVYRGGTGVTFDWDLIPQTMVREKLILAGGLHPGNVSDAITAVNPLGVDVSSGVETDGIKDLEKIKEFIKQVNEVHHD